MNEEAVSVGGTERWSWLSDRDDVGRISGLTETTATMSVAFSYDYDALGRLTTVRRGRQTVEQYAYNANGTRSTDTNALRRLATRTFAYDTEDRLQSVTLGSETTSYAYDADGFLATKTHGADETEYEYSSRGELLSATLPDGRTVEYTHDTLARRVAKKIDGTVTEKYLWSGATTF